MPRTLILLAHPALQESRVHAALWHIAQQRASAAPETVILRDLYAHYPDYAIDVPAEQKVLEAAERIVWMHPIQWYSMPALMKLWIDEVLSLGWAYGTGGIALQGKPLWLVTSTGGSEASYSPAGYNRHAFETFLPPYRQTAALCGMRFVPPLILHGAHGLPAAALQAHAQRFDAGLDHLMDAHCAGEMDVGCQVPETDRPVIAGRQP